MGQRRVWIAVIVSSQQSANDAANVYAVMFKKSAIFSHRDRLDEIRWQVIETDDPAFGSFATCDRADQLRLELSFIMTCAVIPFDDRRDRFAAASKLDSQRLEGLGVINVCIRARINFDGRAVKGVTPPRSFGLLTALDISGPFQISQ